MVLCARIVFQSIAFKGSSEVFETIIYLELIFGFILLMLGGDFLVRGALDFGAKRGISPLIVGVTVVAMGTSAPELVISVLSALSGHPQIALGNVIGSNIANVLLVLGLPVLLHPILTQQDGLKVQVHWMLAITVAFIGLCFFGVLSLIAGIIMLLALALFLFLSVKGNVHFAALDELTKGPVSAVSDTESYWRIIGLIVLGMVALPVGANFVVMAGTSLALNFGVSESVIGASLVALGTSLPELSATLVAAYYRNSDVVLGNVVGSNLFNILAVLGITLLFTDIPVDPAVLRFDLWVMLGAAVLLWLYAMVGAKIGRISGVLFLFGYGGYVWALFSG